MNKTTYVHDVTVARIEHGALVIFGDYGTYLRLTETETDSNLHEISPKSKGLVPQYSALLAKAYHYAKNFKQPLRATRNVTLAAYAFLCTLEDTIGEQAFLEVIRKQQAAPVNGVCYSHDYCDANEVMETALQTLGIPIWDKEGNLDGEAAELWNAAWAHAKVRMAAICPY